MRKLLALTLLGVSAASALAQQLPLDPGTGLTLFTSNSNDGYSGGRGIWFKANGNSTVIGAGFFNNFSGNESFTETLWLADSAGSALHGTNLGSFTINGATAGTQYDNGLFGSSINLANGSFYYLEVTSNSSFAGNYFYNWNGNPQVNLGPVTILDGGQGGDPSALLNTVAPGLQLNFQTVPEPASVAVLGLGALALLRRRRTSK